MREEQVRSASGAESEVVYLLDPDLFEVPPDSIWQREVPAFHHPRTEPFGKLAGELLGDLVAALPDAGPDVGANGLLAHLLDGLPGALRYGTAPAGVDHPHSPGFTTDERHGNAVSDGNRQREALSVRYQRVGLPGEPCLAHLYDPVPGYLAYPGR